MPPAKGAPYHHGELRPVLLAAAAEVIAEVGAGSMSLREVARRAGVSHTAAAYHFGDKIGLLTALAIEGFRHLTSALGETWEQTGDVLELGVAYVRFALAHPAFFDVMFRPDLHHLDDPELVAAKRRARMLLTPQPHDGSPSGSPKLDAGVAEWSLMHGLATLWINGVLPKQLGDDAEAVARIVGRHLSAGAAADSPRA